MEEKLQQVCQAFCIEGAFQSYEEIKVGNVNRTYKVNYLRPDGRPKSYIIQAVNTFVFKKPVEVMENIDKVTEYIHAKQPQRTVLHFHHTPDRKIYLFDDNGFWRLFNYIPSTTYNTCSDLEVVRSAGEAFGEFQMLLADFDAQQLYVTIPDFHDTRKRYQKLLADVAEDPMGMAAQVAEEVEWLKSVQEQACRLTDLYEAGQLPLRVTHNDTKLNNVLMDRKSGEGVCVIDLDTVMPGLSINDFGDSIRFGANHCAEDEKDLSKVNFDLSLFEVYTQGFLEGANGALTQAELDYLPWGAKLMTLECGIRFLTDYLEGDHYFRTHREGQNLDRCRTQFKLVADMENQWEAMKAVVDKYRPN